MRFSLTSLEPPPQTDPREQPAWITYGVGLVLLLHVVLAWTFRSPALAFGEDDAGYILLAKDLLRFDYRELQDIDAPLHARFPPGLPAMLALVGPIFQWKYDALLAFETLTSAAALLFLFLAARRLVDPVAALLAMLLCAVNPLTLRDAGLVMAEAPFKLLLAVGLWAITRERESRTFAIAGGAAIILAALTRTAGLVCVIALFGYWFLSRQYRRAMVFAVAAALTVGSWMTWSIVAPDAANRRLYVADIGLKQSPAPKPGAVAAPKPPAGTAHDELPAAVRVPLTMAKRIGPRVAILTTVTFPASLGFPTIPDTRVDNAVWLVVFVSTLTIGLLVLARRWRVHALILAGYIALLVLWTWALERFVTPILFSLYLSMLLGITWVASRFAPSRPRLATALMVAFTAMVLIGDGQLGQRALANRIGCDRSNPMQSARPCFMEKDLLGLQLTQWVRDSTPPNAVFLTSKERAFYYHTGRLTINQNRALQEDSASFVPFLRSRGVTHAALMLVGLFENNQGRLLAYGCHDLILEKEFPQKTAVFRVRKEGEPDDGGAACGLLAHWRYRKIRHT